MIKQFSNSSQHTKPAQLLSPQSGRDFKIQTSVGAQPKSSLSAQRTNNMSSYNMSSRGTQGTLDMLQTEPPVITTENDTGRLSSMSARPKTKYFVDSRLSKKTQQSIFSMNSEGAVSSHLQSQSNQDLKPPSFNNDGQGRLTSIKVLDGSPIKSKLKNLVSKTIQIIKEGRVKGQNALESLNLQQSESVQFRFVSEEQTRVKPKLTKPLTVQSLRRIKKLNIQSNSQSVAKLTLQQKATESQTFKRVTTLGDQIQHKESTLEIDRIRTDLITQEEPENQEELILFDIKCIEQRNRTAHESYRRTHHQPQSKGNSPLRRGKTKIMSTVQSPTENHKVVNVSEQKPSEFLKKYEVANQCLDKISTKDYYYCLKHIDRLEEYQKLYKQKDNIYTSLLKASKSCDTLPKKIDLIKDVTTMEITNASRQLSRKPYQQMLAYGLMNEQCQTLKSVSLARNNLNVNNLPICLQNLPEALHIIDLSNNHLDIKAMHYLSKHMDQNLQHLSLRSLNLEQNKFGDIGCKILLEGLTNPRQLNVINLSKNNITVSSCEHLARLIRKTTTLQEMYLHFNSINASGGATLFKAITRNSTIKVLDVSYNNMGGPSQANQPPPVPTKYPLISDCAQSIAKVLSKPHPELVHFDLQHNGFNEADSREIARSIFHNQNIYGFHFEGNFQPLVVDSAGFLTYAQEEADQLLLQLRSQPSDLLKALHLTTRTQKFIDYEELEHEDHNRQGLAQRLMEYESKTDTENRINHSHRFRRINSTNPLPFFQPQLRMLNFLDTCWICEGWQEVKFSWQPGKSGSIRTEPLFVHIDFEGYRPMLMTIVQEEFFLFKMCPPNAKIHYFFSNPVHGIQTVAKNQLTEELDENNALRRQTQKYIYNQEIELEGQTLTHLNYCHASFDKVVIDSHKHYIPLVYCKPREEPKKFDFSAYRLGKANLWSVENSIFKNFQADNEALINECFEFDFAHSKVARLVKDHEVDAVKDILHSLYQHLFQAYKYYCSSFNTANIPCISMNSFNELIAQTQILDHVRIRNTDIDVNFISSNGKDLKYPQVYEKALIRYQLMEMFVRIALDKYYKTGTCKTIAQSLAKVIQEDQLKSWLQEFDTAQEWRDERFWTQKCDTLLKSKLPFLRILFQYTSSINPKTKYYKNAWVASKDFRDLLNQCGLVCELLTERDAYLAFLLAMPTQVDELFQSRHYQMHFYEFLEALARAAEKLSLVAPMEFNPRKKEESSPNLDDRRLLPLETKLEGLLLIIYYRLGEQIKKQYQHKTNDDDLAEFDSAILGMKRAKLRLSVMQTLTISPNITQRLKLSINAPARPLAQQLQNTYSDSESDGSDSDGEKDYFDPVKQEFSLAEQLKAQAPKADTELQINSKSKISFFQLVKEAKKAKMDRIKDNFTLVTVVRYIKRKEESNIQRQIQQLSDLQ